MPGYERKFAQIVGTLVRVNQVLQDFFPFFSPDAGNPAVLKSHGEILDQVSVVIQRHGADHRSMNSGSCWRGKHLFGGHVGDEFHPVGGSFRSAQPDMILWQLHPKIRTQ